MCQTTEPDESTIIDMFRLYVDVVTSTSIDVLRMNPETNDLFTQYFNRGDKSRYTARGRRRLMARLRKRLSPVQIPGVLATFTIDPKETSRLVAWQTIWKEFAGFRKRLWSHRKYKGQVPSPAYIAVLEPMPSNDYPHMHVAYPGLRWLADREVMKSWSLGRSHIAGPGSDVHISPAGYCVKYVSKMNGWSLRALAYLWFSRARMYNISPRLYQTRIEKETDGNITLVYDNEFVQTKARVIADLGGQRVRGDWANITTGIITSLSRRDSEVEGEE